MKKIKSVKICECKKCKFQWIQRHQGITPRACPRCKSYYWNRRGL